MFMLLGGTLVLGIGPLPEGETKKNGLALLRCGPMPVTIMLLGADPRLRATVLP